MGTRLRNDFTLDRRQVDTGDFSVADDFTAGDIKSLYVPRRGTGQHHFQRIHHVFDEVVGEAIVVQNEQIGWRSGCNPAVALLSGYGEEAVLVPTFEQKSGG